MVTPPINSETWEWRIYPRSWDYLYQNWANLKLIFFFCLFPLLGKHTLALYIWLVLGWLPTPSSEVEHQWATLCILQRVLLWPVVPSGNSLLSPSKKGTRPLGIISMEKYSEEHRRANLRVGRYGEVEGKDGRLISGCAVDLSGHRPCNWTLHFDFVKHREPQLRESLSGPGQLTALPSPALGFSTPSSWAHRPGPYHLLGNCLPLCQCLISRDTGASSAGFKAF